MNGAFKIIGGNPLKGEVIPILNKNSLMGSLPLAVLNCKGVSYHDLPQTSDVEYILEIYRRWGAKIETVGKNITRIDTSDIRSYEIDQEIGTKFRGAFSFTGPLLARFGKAQIPMPGGCKLGARSLSTHITAFKDLGVEVEEIGKSLLFTYDHRARSKEKMIRNVWLLEASVTATLNLSMFVAGSDMEVEIRDAACEPHVVDVLNTLNSMGAEISGIGTNHLHIKGNPDLHSTDFYASPDFVDIGGYCVAGAITGGEIRIKGANIPWIMDGILKWLGLFGVTVIKEKDDLIVKGDEELVIKKEQFPLAGKDLPKFTVRPWPGFPVDLLPVFVTLATKAKGSMLFQNWMYESGFDFIRELNYMGAEIYMSDPQKIIVMEPVIRFSGGEVAAPGIIQGTKAIFLAALADKVQTIIHGTDILRRRYPNILEIYEGLGAKIEKYNL